MPARAPARAPGLYAAVAPRQDDDGRERRHDVVDPRQPVSATTGLTINDIYQRTYQGVVDITVDSTSGGAPFGGSQSSQAEGSGFVYDKRGDIVTNQHVVAGATSITVKLWNGKTYKGTSSAPTTRPTSRSSRSPRRRRCCTRSRSATRATSRSATR